HEFPEKNDEPLEVKPLKKLVQFNKAIKLLLIMIRVAVLSYIVYTSIAYVGLVEIQNVYLYIQSSIYILYLPASLFLLVFTFVFLNKKWLFYSIIVDVAIIFSLEFI